MIIAKLFVLHFVADFILQSREMGKKKSSEWRWLAAHLAIQFTVFLLVGWKFALANALIHGIIDKNIWNLYKLSVLWRCPEFAKISTEDQAAFPFWEDHLFYATIGFDQLLHALTLIYLAGYLL